METEAVIASVDLASSDWVSAGGLILMFVGASFLVLEFFLPSFGLFGFAGVASILIGIIQLHQTGYIERMPVSVETLIGLAIFGLILSGVGGWYSWKLYRRKLTTGIEGMVGEPAQVIEWQGTKGRVHIQGEDWQAYSNDPLSLQKDDKVIVAKIDGLKIKIITAP